MKAKIYTKTGDKGQTSLVGGTRVPKTHLRIEAYGTLDELNSELGVVAAHLSELRTEPLRVHMVARLELVQRALFCMGSHLACENETMASSLPGLSASDIEALEADMDQWESELPPLKNFILPGGTALASHTHVGRAVCRRAERTILKLREMTSAESDHIVFLNRLSDWLFLAARKFNADAGREDVLWR